MQLIAEKQRLSVYHYSMMNNRQKQAAKLKLLTVMLCCMFSSLEAQENQQVFKRNAFYVELLGQGGLYSVNYDYRVNRHFSLRAGFTYVRLNFFFSDSRVTGFPLMASYLLGKDRGHFETGMGVMPTWVHTENPDFSFSSERTSSSALEFSTCLHIGYRYQPPEGGFVFRAGFTPVYSEGEIYPFGGLSFGYAF